MACQYGPWDAPSPALVGAPPTSGPVARFPSIATGARLAYVVGNDVAFFDARPVQANSLVAWELGRGSVGRPDGSFTYVYPRAAVDGRDRLHVLWAEPAAGQPTVAAYRWPPEPFTSLWSAMYEPGRGWSIPKRVYDAGRIIWAPASVAPIARAPDGSLSIATPSFSDSSGAKVVYLRLRDERWEAFPLPINGAVAAASSAAAAGSSVVVAYLAGDLSGGQDINSVFVTRSEDDGRTWSPARVVSRSGSTPAHEVHVLREGLRTVHLVWRQLRADGRTAVRHISSPDGGATWSQPDDLAGAPGSVALRATMSTCGGIHVIYEDWGGGGERGHLDHAMWRDGWSGPEHLFTAWRANSADIRAGDDGRVTLTFLGQPADAPLTAPISSLRSEIRPR